jgi:hypothetical protein
MQLEISVHGPFRQNITLCLAYKQPLQLKIVFSSTLKVMLYAQVRHKSIFYLA